MMQLLFHSFIFEYLSYKTYNVHWLILNKSKINADDKSKPSQVHVFVPVDDPAASASGHTMMIKRSSQTMDEVNLENA